MYEKQTLPNGVRIVYEHMPHVRSAAIGVWVGVGSRYESPCEAGSAHFIEHMLFKGTAQHSASELAERMDAIGGQVNAYTTREGTCYYARVLDEHLDRAGDLLAEMLFTSNFSETDADNERGVIREEMDMYADTPEDLVTERLIGAAFPGALGRPVLGRPATIDRLTGARLRSFQIAHYIAPRIVIAVSGSFTDENIARLAAHFSWLPVRPDLTMRSGSYTPAFTLKRKAIEQNQISIGFPGMPTGAEERFTMALLSSILGGNMSSRLFQTVREKNGLCYAIYTYTASFLDCGMFGISAAVGRETEQRALALIRDELERFRTDGVTQSELDRAREQVHASVLMAEESTASRMNKLGYSELYLGRVLPADEVLARADGRGRDGSALCHIGKAAVGLLRHGVDAAVVHGVDARDRRRDGGQDVGLVHALAHGAGQEFREQHGGFERGEKFLHRVRARALHADAEALELALEGVRVLQRRAAVALGGVELLEHLREAAAGLVIHALFEMNVVKCHVRFSFPTHR